MSQNKELIFKEKEIKYKKRYFIFFKNHVKSKS